MKIKNIFSLTIAISVPFTALVFSANTGNEQLETHNQTESQENISSSSYGENENFCDIENEINSVDVTVKANYAMPQLVNYGIYDESEYNTQYDAFWYELGKINSDYTKDSDEYYVVAFKAWRYDEVLPIDQIILKDSNENIYYPTDYNYDGILIDETSSGYYYTYEYYYAVFDKSEINNYSYYVNIISTDRTGATTTVTGMDNENYWTITIEENKNSSFIISVITVGSIIVVTIGVTFTFWILKKKKIIA